MKRGDFGALGFVFVVLVGVACTKAKPLVCDGPTTPPAAEEPCPPGTSVVRPHKCPFDTCRYCEKPDHTRHGPFATWYTAHGRIEVVPDKHGHWGSVPYMGRGAIQDVGWFKNGVRDGAFVRKYKDGTKALEATYCNGVVREPVRRWTEQGAPLDAGAGWLTPPDGGA